jgi:uncharacterized damage-inducible protein DinB
MDLVSHFQMLATYNRIANERIYEACAALHDEDYRKARAGSFGSIAALLNHILLGDRIWMARFEGGGTTTPPLDTTLFDDFASLRTARREEDVRIESFFQQLQPADFLRTMSYVNNKGRQYEEAAPVAFAHFFNHQTHHRGQVHVMLSETAVQPLSLDLHRIINP